MRLRERGLVARLVLAVVVAGTASAALGALLLSWAARSTLQAEVVQRSSLVAQELAVRLDGRVANYQNTLQLVAANRAVTQLSAEAAAELRTVLRTSATFDELVLYDAEGRPVSAAANAFAAETVDYADRPDIAEHATAGYVGLVDAFPPVLEMAVPVENPPGTAVGFLLARLPLELLAAAIQQHDVRTGTTSFLVDSAGTVLVHPERDRMVDRERFPLDELADTGGATTVDVGGDRLIAARAPLEAFSGAVVLTQDERIALRPVSRRLFDLLAILGAVLATTMVAVSLAGGWLLRPLSQLLEAVHRLGRGERGVRVGQSGTGEIAQLAGEFDRMAATLDRRDAQLAELQRLSLHVNAAVDRDGLTDDLVRGARSLLQSEAAAFVALRDGGPTITAAGTVLDPALVGELIDASADGAARVSAVPDGHALSVPVSTFTGATLGVLTTVRRAGDFTEEELRLATAFAAFAGVALDNARRLQLEQALVHELQDSVERRRMLIGGVSHEFRTPLTCIAGFSSELEERWDELTPEERQALLGKIHQHAEELDRLVTQLLEFAATERGRTSTTMSVVRLADIVQQEVASLAPLLAGRPVSSTVPDTEVLADPRMLRGVLNNLVSNAVKYSLPGTPVTIRAEHSDDEIRVDVRDEGIGMSPAELDLAFEPFWRAPGARSERGTGLGLALVAEYVRAMGGMLTATSEPGEGSTFSFTLRARVREAQP